MLKSTPLFIMCNAGIRTGLLSNTKFADKSVSTCNMPLNSSECVAFLIYNYSLKLIEVFCTENTNKY